MKKILIFVVEILIFLTATTIAIADGIEMLSESYSIHASWDYTWYQDTGQGYVVTPYHGTSATLFSTGGYPLDFQSIISTPPGVGSRLSSRVSISRFNYLHFADSPSWAVEMYNQLDGYMYEVIGARIVTHAEAYWQFRPTDGLLNVNIYIDAQSELSSYAGLTVKLWDTNNGTTLIDFSCHDYFYPALPLTPSVFDMQTDHIYELLISGWSDMRDGDRVGHLVTASITSVPEPATTILLGLGLGLIGLAGVWRKYGK
jgi:hypothetical protein